MDKLEALSSFRSLELSWLNLLHLLQLASPALPVGAYSYSEGLELLVERQVISNAQHLYSWLAQELAYGAIRVEGAVLLWAYRAVQQSDRGTLQAWNDWLSAFRETEELRQQSWQMGRSLLKLLRDLTPISTHFTESLQTECNFAIAFALAAAHWQIDSQATLLAYLQSWTANLVSAGIKLIPLGQTAGQALLLELYPIINQAVQDILTLPNEGLCSCSWGLTLASMAHETQYTRLFRS